MQELTQSWLIFETLEIIKALGFECISFIQQI